jgi:hypothetical protein
MKDFIPENIWYISRSTIVNAAKVWKTINAKTISISEEILRFMWNQITLLKYYMKN